MVYDKTVRGTNSASEHGDGIHAVGLGKRFGELWALRGVDLHAPPGSVLGLLGHNGAGKTTALRILTTLAAPSEGSATVAGYDVVRESAAVRERIGVAAQAATVDGLLTARRNLEMVGRLYHLDRATARRRAGELLEQLELTDDADRLVKTFSGGMRRRLDLAASLVARPAVLFLDEPTTGLDPRSRNALWALLRNDVVRGTTVVLTTQYLEEADRLADHIVVLDHGRVAASGTPAELKARIGGDRLVVTISNGTELWRAREAVARFSDGEVRTEPGTAQLIAAARAGTRLIEVVRALDAAGIDVHDVHRREVTLDDVFLTITHSGALERAA